MGDVMVDFTFLEQEQVVGEKKLEILEKYGLVCTLTDFSILLGGCASFNYYLDNTAPSKVTRASWWWLKSTNDEKDALSIFIEGSLSKSHANFRTGGARLATSYSSIKEDILKNVVVKNGILQGEYGEYPQMVADEDISQCLETLYLNNELLETGKNYITDSANIMDNDKSFEAQEHIEYEYNDKKYIRFIATENNERRALSNGHIIKKGDVVWVKVEPVKWLIDLKNNIALSEKILFGGVQFSNDKYYDGNFSNTNIKKYIDTYFKKDIVPSISNNINKNKVKKI